jgi:hypothetical protein
MTHAYIVLVSGAGSLASAGFIAPAAIIAAAAGCLVFRRELSVLLGR